MWNAVPYLGKAASAVLIFIFILPVAVDLYWAPSLKGDLIHNWAAIASKNIFEKLTGEEIHSKAILTDLYWDRSPESASQAYTYWLI